MPYSKKLHRKLLRVCKSLFTEFIEFDLNMFNYSQHFMFTPTIRPNAKNFNRLFMDQNTMTWEVRTHQIGFIGEPNEGKLGSGEFHENPTSCICQDSKFKARQLLTPQNQSRLMCAYEAKPFCKCTCK